MNHYYIWNADWFSVPVLPATIDSRAALLVYSLYLSTIKIVFTLCTLYTVHTMYVKGMASMSGEEKILVNRKHNTWWSLYISVVEFSGWFHLLFHSTAIIIQATTLRCLSSSFPCGNKIFITWNKRGDNLSFLGLLLFSFIEIIDRMLDDLHVKF